MVAEEGSRSLHSVPLASKLVTRTFRYHPEGACMPLLHSVMSRYQISKQTKYRPKLRHPGARCALLFPAFPAFVFPSISSMPASLFVSPVLPSLPFPEFLSALHSGVARDNGEIKKPLHLSMWGLIYPFTVMEILFCLFGKNYLPFFTYFWKPKLLSKNSLSRQSSFTFTQH